MPGHAEVDLRGAEEAILIGVGLELPEIRATSPTLAEVMRSCLLRAGLSRTVGSSRFVLGNPKAWLGNAYHAVLERIPEIDPAIEMLEAGVDRLWNEAIAIQYQRITTHPLDRRFGQPATWPGYHLARASVRLRAREFLAAIRSDEAAVNVESTIAAGPTMVIREQEFTAFGGKLVGRPDVVRAGEVVDYKSGELLEYDEDSHADVVKTAYVRQLQIYGYLVKEVLGWWPLRGRLLPLAGVGVEVPLSPAECEREALAAIASLDNYNAKVRVKAPAAEFAIPSPVACKWCPYKVICPAFWQGASVSWSGQLDGAAIEATVRESPHAIHGGAALAIPIDIETGTEAPQKTEIAPLNPAVHSVASELSPGELIRLIGLRVRPDGVFLPGRRTVLARSRELPEIAGGGGSTNHCQR